MANRIEGYLGCQACGTVLFRLESEPAARPGVFSHVTAAMDGVDAPGDGKVCPSCGGHITRVTAP